MFNLRQKLCRYVFMVPGRHLYLISVFCAAALTALSISFANAQSEEINTRPLKVSARVEPQTVSAETKPQVNLQLSLADGYHAYLEKFTLRLISPDSLALEPIELSPVTTFTDPITHKPKSGLKGEGQLRANLKILQPLSEGNTDLVLELTYQACTDTKCLFPTKETINVSLTTEAPTSGSFEWALSKGLPFTFVFVFFFGILTSFTPCIFPMIPITLSIIGASQLRHGPGSHEAIRTHSRWRGFSLSVSYVLGIAITYAILGWIAASTGALFGAALANPWIVGSVALIFIAIGLSMYGLYEIQMPAFIRDPLSRTKTDVGYVGAFAAGLISGIVASPCVSPILVSLLAYVAQARSVVIGISMLFTFAIGMGLLLIAVGTFSSTAARLPRSGPWMEFIKFIFGTSIIGMAFYYLYGVIPRSAFYLGFAAACIFISSYFGAFEPNQNLKTSLQKIKKGIMIALFVFGLVYAVRGVLEQVPFLLPTALPPAEMMPTRPDDLNWRRFKEEELDSALAQGQPVVIDFFAEWCTACKELEKFTFSDPQVKSELKNFALFRVDMTVDTKETASIKERFKIVGLPNVQFFSQGQRRDKLTLTGYESKDEFLKRLRRVKDQP